MKRICFHQASCQMVPRVALKIWTTPKPQMIRAMISRGQSRSRTER